MKLLYIFLVYFILFPLNSISNVIGNDMQNFNPTTSGIDFVTVQSTETLEPGIINFGLFLNYSINSLPYYVDPDTQNRMNFNDTLLMADINFGIGIIKNLDIGFSFPHLLRQKVDNDTFHLQFENTGMLEIRANTKYKFFSYKNHGIAAIASVNFNKIVDNPFTGHDPGPTYNFELAYDTSYKDWAFGTNIGYRKRNSGEPVLSSVTSTVIIEPFKDQILASLGASYLFKQYDTKIIAEYFSSFPAQKASYQSNRSQISSEIIMGLKYDLRQNVAIHGGGGTKINHGNASPDWRIYAGVNYSFGPIFSIPDSLKKVGDQTEDQETYVIEGLLFEFNSDNLKPSARGVLKDLALYLENLKSYRLIIIEGHTDSIGDAAYNLNLSKRRADRVKNYLITVHKIEEKKLETIGFGETKPIGDNGNYQGRKKNRRVQFKIFLK